MPIKGHYSVTNLQKMMPISPKLDLVSVDVHTKFVKFCNFILKILTGNKILTSIKGHNSGTHRRKMTCYNPRLDPVNVDVFTKFDRILSKLSQDTKQK